MTAAIGPALRGISGSRPVTRSHVRLPLENRGLYEVLFRPYLCHQDDPDFMRARMKGSTALAIQIA